MITRISIKNFAIIADVEVDFQDGLNIITGETGSGKSIVIEAVSLALGARADTAYIRTGEEKALVQLVAELDGEEYIITRELSSTGRNLCKINGEIVTLAQLGELCRRIADIHGQYDHQSLLNPDSHIQLIDLYGKEAIAPLKAAVSKDYEAYTDLSRKLSLLLKNESEMRRTRDFKQFEFDEIEKAALRVGEDEQLEEQINLLQNSEKIYGNLEHAYALSYGDGPNVDSSLSGILSLLEEISSYSSSLEQLKEQISDIYYSFEDVVREIRSEKDHITFSPEELDTAIERLEVINMLKKKYGATIEEILKYKEQLEEELALSENTDAMKETLTKELKEAEEQLKISSGALSKARKSAAASLQNEILTELKDLNFQDADLDVAFREASYSAEGTDQVEFMLTTNKGEQLKPLAKVASGGEMSRIMLAFKKIIGDYDQIPTMIFDEIDTGISGITASIVARKMKQIAKGHQIICITHLPQIAAAGTHNYRIEKNVRGDATFTSITPLDPDEKVSEIARLLGGTSITEITLKSAEELIRSSK